MKDLITVGYMTDTKGIKGEVKVKNLSDAPGRFAPSKKFLLNPPTSNLLELEIESFYTHKDLIIIKFVEINTLEQAQEIKGKYLEVEAEKLEQGQYYAHQLIGLTVKTIEGVELGRVVEIITSGAHDIYKVRHQGRKEYLIPAVKEIVKEINIKKGYILISPTPGLLEL